MFFDIDVMNSKNLGTAWRFAHKQTDLVDINNVSLPEICSSLDKWMSSDQDMIRHMSLRTSSMLINGAARVYREQLDQLMQDCVDLDEKMIQRRRSKTDTAEENSNDRYDSEDTSASSNNTSQRNSQEKESSASKSSGSNDNKTHSVTSTASASASETPNNASNLMKRLRSSVGTSFSEESIKSRRAEDKNDKEVQTSRSYIASERERDRYRGQTPTLDNNLPVGLLVVFDGECRFPNKVIISNVNPDVRRL